MTIKLANNSPIPPHPGADRCSWRTTTAITALAADSRSVSVVAAVAVFSGSPRLILRAGHWCPVCVLDTRGYERQAQRNQFLAQVEEDSTAGGLTGAGAQAVCASRRQRDENDYHSTAERNSLKPRAMIETNP